MNSMSKSWENKKWSATTIFMKLWDNRPSHLTIPVTVVRLRYNPITEKYCPASPSSIKRYDLGDVELLDLIEELKPNMMRYGYIGTTTHHDHVLVEVAA